jgi:type I restriction enzyme M protein
MRKCSESSRQPAVSLDNEWFAIPGHAMRFCTNGNIRGASMNVEQTGSSKLAIIIQQGKVLDFIDGITQRNETPEEYVRPEIAKSLVREYRYEKPCIEVEFTVRVGSRKPRADLVIFPTATDHKQENVLIIVECKSAKIKAEDKKDGVGQLQSYMAACPNVSYGMWTNGIERFATDVS